MEVRSYGPASARRPVRLNHFMRDFARALPKTELHVHIEGTLEPEMMFRMAERNGVGVGFRTADEVHAAYRFLDLQSFLDIYYRGAAVLRTSEDFTELMAAYLEQGGRRRRPPCRGVLRPTDPHR